MQPYIVIIGNVGAGKTSLGQALAAKLHTRFIPADNFFKINPFFPAAVKNRKRWSFISDAWFLNARLNLMQKILTKKNPKPVVVDSGLLMSYVYASSRLSEGYMTKDEWRLYSDLYQKLISNIPTPNLVIHLHAPISFLRDRIIKRGRDFEITHHTPQYLQGLEHSLTKLQSILKKQHIPSLLLEAKNPIKQNLSLISDQLHQYPLL